MFEQIIRIFVVILDQFQNVWCPIMNYQTVKIPEIITYKSRKQMDINPALTTIIELM